MTHTASPGPDAPTIPHVPAEPVQTPSPAPSPPGSIMRFIRAIYARPRRALVAAFLFIAVAGAIGGPGVGTLESDSEAAFIPPDAESVHAVERIEEATGLKAGPGVVLLVETPGEDGNAAVEQAAAALADVDGVAEVTPAGAATDGSSALVLGTLEADAPPGVAGEVLDAFADTAGVTVGGGAVAGEQMGETIGADLARAELLAFPVLTVLAILFFRGRAAVLPVIVGITTVLGTFLALTGITQLYGLSVFALNLVIGLGLGLSVDYTLFLVTRYREELDRQGPTVGALVTTMRTAGRTVVYSSATVAIALATLVLFPMNFLKSMGLAGLVVALMAAAAALLISPMIFGLWGAKLARRRKQHAAASRWYRFSHAVMRRPGVFALGTTAVMVLLALPALRTEWTPVDETVIPTSESARTVSDIIERDYGGLGSTPVSVVVEGAGSPDALAQELASIPGNVAPVEPVPVGVTTWLIDLQVPGDPAGEEARAVVDQARQWIAGDGTDALVGGPAAEFIDQQQAIGDNLLLVGTLLVGLTMLVLWLMTGSVVLPVKAVLMNALTVGVALAAVTWVYQDGRFTDLLGYTSNGGIEPTNFLIAAAVVFALSTDYGVFLLGRVKETRDAGTSEQESVAVGVGRTGAVITAAAILLAVAIGAFSISEISFIQQIGIATAVGVLVDAFVVRSLLVPSLMGVLGKWNWWAPMWLRRLHDRIGLSESGSAPEPATVRA